MENSFHVIFGDLATFGFLHRILFVLTRRADSPTLSSTSGASLGHLWEKHSEASPSFSSIVDSMLSARMPSGFAGDRVVWLPCPESSCSFTGLAVRSVQPSRQRQRCSSSVQKPQRRVPGSAGWAGQEHVSPSPGAAASPALGEAPAPGIDITADDGCSEASTSPPALARAPGRERMHLLVAEARDMSDNDADNRKGRWITHLSP